MKYLSVATCAMLLVFAGQASATLIGDSVEADLSSGQLNVGTNFTSPGVVGGGTEFTGVMTDSFGQIWDIELDVFASGFSIGILERTRNGDGNVIGPADTMVVSLSDLDWIGLPGVITSVYLDDYSCNSQGFSCGVTGGGPQISGISFGDDWTTVSFDVIRDGESFVFAIEAEHIVPEPATMTLMGLGLLGFAVRRRKSNA